MNLPTLAALLAISLMLSPRCLNAAEHLTPKVKDGTWKVDPKKPAYYFRILTVGPMPPVIYLPGSKADEKIEYTPNSAYTSALIRQEPDRIKGGILELTAAFPKFENGAPTLSENKFARVSLESNKPTLICFLRLLKGKNYAPLRQLTFDISPDKPPACIVLNLTDRPVAALFDPKVPPQLVNPEQTLELPSAQASTPGAPYLRLAIGNGTKYVRLNLGRLPLKPGGRSMVIVFPVDPAANNNIPADINAFEID